ncbi:cytochrome P450 [Xylaria arbuscula]|nr:cytochrome P450 [Xylaria arbuscula]
MASFTHTLLPESILSVVGISLSMAAIWIIGYVVYQRFLHPLAAYPGPVMASFTDLWQVCEFLNFKQPYNLTDLHQKYGQFVRYGPDKLSTTAEEAIPLIFQKGGRAFPKTEFYDAYGSTHPNVFGMRDETEHSIRRRHISHSFSMSSVKGMEHHLDANLKLMKQKLSQHAQTQDPFDLKKVLHYYVIDVLGELAFGQSFGVQASGDESLVPPVVEHSYLAAVTGAWPSMTRTLRKWLPRVPSRELRRLFEGRAACAALAACSVQRRMKDLKDTRNHDPSSVERKDILTSLILAKDPQTGLHLTQADLETEAFGFIIAGTHTTSATTSLLFYHLLHAPEEMKKCVDEVDSQLTPLSEDKPAYSVAEVESSLPYLRQCIKENFRITPVFTMPLARRVTAPEGVVIAGRHIKQGTSIAVCNHAFHHNPAVWGDNHNIFDPSRWNAPEIAARGRYLMHFGLGGRQCIGKTLAQTNIYKLTSTLLREFEFSLVEAERPARGKLPELMSVGISDLKNPMMVRVKARTP